MGLREFLAGLRVAFFGGLTVWKRLVNQDLGIKDKDRVDVRKWGELQQKRGRELADLILLIFAMECNQVYVVEGVGIAKHDCGIVCLRQLKSDRIGQWLHINSVSIIA